VLRLKTNNGWLVDVAVCTSSTEWSRGSRGEAGKSWRQAMAGVLARLSLMARCQRRAPAEIRSAYGYSVEVGEVGVA